ncbi:MAG: hypothetical protein AAFO94_18365, partial [Bacteroidota bacterium]
ATGIGSGKGPGHGNTATAVQKINVTDDEPPVFTSVPPNGTFECGDEALAGNAMATDNCGAVDISFSDSKDIDPCVGGSFVRTFVATDICGNTTSATQMINQLPDTQAPVFTFVPADQTMGCGGDPDMGMATAEDACGDVVVTFEDSGSGADCGDGAFVRTFTATDACGNVTTAQQVINISDNEPPVFTSVPADKMSNECGDGDADFGTPEVSDNCGNVTLTSEDAITNADCSTGLKRTRTWTATDDCGNTATAQQTIMFGPDTDPPIWTFFPPDMKITCGEPIELGMPTAEDECSGGVTLTFSDEYNTDTTNCGNGFGYDIYRTWKATDACGNMTTSIQAAWIVTPDYVGGTPFAFIPENNDLNCTDKDELGAPICQSPCGELKLTTVDFLREEDCLNGLSYTRVWRAMDACGNVQTAYQSLAIPRDRVSVFQNTITDKTMQCGEVPDFDDPVCA